MKQITISLLASVILLSSCRKESTGSETWQVLDECQAKNSRTACITTMPENVNICCEQLRDAKCGRVTVLTENVNARLVRHYIKKIK